MNKLIKYVSFFLLSLIVAVLLLAIFSQTPIFKNWLKEKLIAIAENQINAEIELDALKGNLFTYVQLEGLTLKVDGQDFIQIERALIRYRPSALLLRRLFPSQVYLEAPQVTLIQRDSTHWNFSALLQANDSPTDTVSEKSPWEIAAPDVQISTGVVEIQMRAASQPTIPKRIQNLNLALGFWLKGDQVQVALEKLAFEAREPDLVVRTVQSNVQYGPDKLRAEYFEIETAESKLESQFDLQNFSDPTIDFVLRGQPLSLSEVRRAVPVLEIFGSPKIEVAAKGTLKNLGVSAHISMGEGSLDFSGNLRIKDAPMRYSMKGKTTHLNLAEITNQDDLASDLNFQFQMDGENFDWRNMLGKLVVDFDTCFAGGRRIDPARLECEIDSGTVNFKATILTGRDGVAADLAGKIISTPTDARYQLRASIKEFDLGKFLNEPGLSSNLNLALNVDGQGTTYPQMRGQLNLTVFPSSINGVPIDTAAFNLQLTDQIVKLQQVAISSPMGKLWAAGEISIHKENDLRLDAEFVDFSVLSQTLPVDSLRGAGHFVGRLAGPLDSLQVHANLDLSSMRANEIAVEQFKAVGSGVYSKAGTRFQIDGEAGSIAAAGLRDLNSQFKIEYADSAADFNLQIKRLESWSAQTQGELRWLPQGYELILRDLAFQFSNQTWQSASPETRLRISGNRYSVSPLQLVSGDQSVTIAGQIDMAELSQLNLQLANIDMSGYSQFSQYYLDVAGRLNLNLDLFGKMAQPRVQGQFAISNLQYYQVPFSSFDGWFAFQQDSLTWKAVLSKVENDSLFESSGYLPAKLALEPFEFKVLDQEPLIFKLSSNGLDLSFLQALVTGIKNIKGTLYADIVLRNTLKDLRGVGPIRLVNGEFDIPELGTKYRKLNVSMLLKEKELQLNELRLNSDGGELRLVGGGLALSEKSLQNFKAIFEVDNFRLMNDKRMQAKAKGKLELSGSVKAPYVSGELTVTEARIYYPAWFENENLVELTSRPFFIISDDTAVVDTSGAMRFQKFKDIAEEDFTQSELYKNLHGELALYFPRNTWVRSEDANIEIQGELALVKEPGPDISLFGSFAAQRGQYQLLGNRFQIERGELVFHGEPEPNPEVDIEAVYEFQDASGDNREKHQFRVKISGTLNAPQFQFSLDGQVAEQEDILAILLFGQPKSSLTPGQQVITSKEGGLDERARGLVTGQVLKALSGKLGEGLRLDVIQIESGRNLSDSKVRIGKYVTDDVFVSVSQDFGGEGNQKVELEYELPKKFFFLNLLLQASMERKGSTGVDVIWKIEW